MNQPHSWTATIAAGVLVCAALGCDKTQPAAQPRPPPAPPAQAVAPTPQPTLIAESALRELVASWTAAQNQGAFADYERLYASKFMGVKRAGERVTQFTRETWLEDRKRMFAKPVTVEVSELRMRAAAESAEVSFTQRWASERYEDVGPKRLLVVREGGGLKIAQEELLRSELVKREPAALGFDFHFTLPLQSGLYMPLPEAPVPDTHGPVRAERELAGTPSGIYTSSAPVSDGDLPASVLAWKGAKLRLDDGCLAEVRSFVLLTRVEPHFGTVQEWTGQGDLTADGKPPAALSEAQIAQAAFGLTTPKLAALLHGCAEGSYAQREQTPVPVQAVQVSDAALLQKARAAFAKLPSVLALQKRHRVEAEDPSGLWWESSVQVQAFRHPVSGQTLVSVRADNGGVCAEFSAAEWVIFEQRDAKLVRLYSGAPPAELVRALDVNADGRLELLVTHQSFDGDVALVSPDEQGPSLQLEHAYQDCPC